MMAKLIQDIQCSILCRHLHSFWAIIKILQLVDRRLERKEKKKSYDKKRVVIFVMSIVIKDVNDSIYLLDSFEYRVRLPLSCMKYIHICNAACIYIYLDV